VVTVPSKAEIIKKTKREKPKKEKDGGLGGEIEKKGVKNP